MNAVVSPESGHEVTNRFQVALLFSLLLHAIVILGVGFQFAKPAPSVPTLDVTLVNTANAEAPTKADFLAQANNTGGGNSDKAHRPGARFSGPLPIADAGVAPVARMPAAPVAHDPTRPRILTTRGPATFAAAPQTDAHAAPQPKQPVSTTPAERRLEMARLAQEVRAEEESYARRPHRKYISASTRSVANAAYQVAWVDRIERVGNLNYPDAARREHLHGDVVLTVVLDTAGHVRDITVNHSSGQHILDAAAIRIVHLAAPFPSIPQQKGADGHAISELAITRTWQFLPGNHLQTRGTGAH